MLLNVKVTGKNTHMFQFIPNIHCFPNKNNLTHSTYHWHSERNGVHFFSFQIIKSNSSGNWLLLSALRNKLLFCKWVPCYYMHLFCLLSHRNPGMPVSAVFLSSFMGPSHMSDTNYLVSQPISWLNFRRMWNCLTSLQMRIALCQPNHTWCIPVSSIPMEWLQVLAVRQIWFLELWLDFQCWGVLMPTHQFLKWVSLRKYPLPTSVPCVLFSPPYNLHIISFPKIDLGNLTTWQHYLKYRLLTLCGATGYIESFGTCWE